MELEDRDGNPNDPVKVRIWGTNAKSGSSRIAFISQEAKEALQEWLRIREKYLVTATGKSHIHRKNEVDERLFPFEPPVAHLMWRGAVKKAGLAKRDPVSGKWSMTPHSLCKYCRTRMGSMISMDVSEALIKARTRWYSRNRRCADQCIPAKRYS